MEILQTNSNITNAQLAQEIGLSPAPTLERVKKLENQKVLQTLLHVEIVMIVAVIEKVETAMLVETTEAVVVLQQLKERDKLRKLSFND